jgi:hypothetical protein
MRISSRSDARLPFAAVAVALALFGLGTTAGMATDIRQAAPTVNVTGDGGPVQVAGASVSVAGVAASVRAAGALVSVNVTTTAGISVVGAQVSVASTVGGNLKAGGAVLDISGSVTGNADIGGAVVKAGLTVGGSLHAGAANLTLLPNTEVHGDLAAFGAVVSIAGHVTGKVNAGGAVVTFDGQADGPVEIAGNRIVIGPDAKIAGDLTVHSMNAPEIAQGAVISGTVNQIQPSTWWSIAPWTWALAVAAAVAAGTILAGIVLMLFGGHVFRVATENVRHRPLSSFLFGILAFVLIPFVAAILIATLVGITIGFAVLLILPFLIIFGHAVAAAGIAAGLLIRRRGELGVGITLLMLIIGAIVLVGLGLIPWVGPAIVGIAVVLGTGAFTRTIGGRLRRADPAPLI